MFIHAERGNGPRTREREPSMTYAKPLPSPELPEVTEAAPPFTWITPALVARYSDDDRMGPGRPGSRSALRALLPQMLDEAREDPASWPDQVAYLASRPWVWTLATAAIADGLPVSAETTAKVASLRARGLL